jgi:hypothetical protein
MIFVRAAAGRSSRNAAFRRLNLQWQFVGTGTENSSSVCRSLPQLSISGQRAHGQSSARWSIWICRSGYYYLVNRALRGRIRLNPVADYQCTEAAIGDHIPLHGTAAFHCIQRSSRSLARLRNSATACGTNAVGPSPRATGPADLGSKSDEDVQ